MESNQPIGPANTAQKINLFVSDLTDIESIVGLDASGDTVGAGVGIDAGVIAKELLATIDGTVAAGGNITAQATGTENGAAALGTEPTPRSTASTMRRRSSTG